MGRLDSALLGMLREAPGFAVDMARGLNASVAAVAEELHRLALDGAAQEMTGPDGIWYRIHPANP